MRNTPQKIINQKLNDVNKIFYQDSSDTTYVAVQVEDVKSLLEEVWNKALEFAVEKAELKQPIYTDDWVLDEESILKHKI